MAVDVLIAEDEPSILESLDFILRRAGWSIASVTDGEAVLAALRRDRPKVLVVAYDGRAKRLPGWLSEWKVSQDEAIVVAERGLSEDRVRYVCYERKLAPGERFALGGNRAGGGEGLTGYLAVLIDAP